MWPVPNLIIHHVGSLYRHSVSKSTLIWQGWETMWKSCVWQSHPLVSLWLIHINVSNQGQPSLAQAGWKTQNTMIWLKYPTSRWHDQALELKLLWFHCEMILHPIPMCVCVNGERKLPHQQAIPRHQLGIHNSTQFWLGIYSLEVASDLTGGRISLTKLPPIPRFQISVTNPGHLCFWLTCYKSEVPRPSPWFD